MRWKATALTKAVAENEMRKLAASNGCVACGSREIVFAMTEPLVNEPGFASAAWCYRCAGGHG